MRLLNRYNFGKTIYSTRITDIITADVLLIGQANRLKELFHQSCYCFSVNCSPDDGDVFQEETEGGKHERCGRLIICIPDSIIYHHWSVQWNLGWRHYFACYVASNGPQSSQCQCLLGGSKARRGKSLPTCNVGRCGHTKLWHFHDLVIISPFLVMMTGFHPGKDSLFITDYD